MLGAVGVITSHEAPGWVSSRRGPGLVAGLNSTHHPRVYSRILCLFFPFLAFFIDSSQLSDLQSSVTYRGWRREGW